MKTIAALALAASKSAAEPTVHALAWMAGTWEGADADGTAMEGLWTEPFEPSGPLGARAPRGDCRARPRQRGCLAYPLQEACW